MTARVEVATRPTVEDAETLSAFCRDLFLSFARSDQRRWGEAYLRGLVSVPGRKSIRRISDQIVGRRADQSLQQFVNQSPWEWEPVRRSLAQRVSAALRPQAWVVEEVAFPKNGNSSVGVAKQYASSVGRMLNCQLGLATFLVGEDGSCPVNWRLVLPQSWDADQERRARAGVPDNERFRPRWHHLLDAVDELADAWEVNPAPIVLDGRQDSKVEPLLRGLEERGMRYLVQVGEETPALPATVRPPSVRASRPMGVAELVRHSAQRGRATLTWRESPHGRPLRSQFLVVPVPGATEPVDIVPGRPFRRTRRIVAEWQFGASRPSSLWMTNLNTARLPDLVNLLQLRGQAQQDLARLHEESGLQHFEGRSFRGWHHHVTLASAAHAYRLLHGLATGVDADLRRLRPAR